MATIRSNIARFSNDRMVLMDVIGLVVIAALVHLVYFLFIDPAAEVALKAAEAIGDVPERTIAVVVKDLEQELCFILFFWCIWLWAFRYRLFTDEAYLFESDFLEVESVESYDEPTLVELEQKLDEIADAFPDSKLLSCVGVAVNTLRQHGDFKEANDAAMDACELHLEVMNSNLSITKYILWAIPSVGFLGTVRGIGQALAQAGEAMGGDITGVASSLGVAFNSTFVALFLSLILMFVSYVLQGREEKLIATTKSYISSLMIPRLGALARQAKLTQT